MIDPATLVAYLDGELGPAVALCVEAALAEDNALRERLAALRRVDGALSAAFDPILEIPLPPLALVSGRPPVGRGSPVAQRRVGRMVALAAGLAGLILGFAGGQFGPSLWEPSEPPGVAAIHAQLPDVLETQLSGTTVVFNDPVQGVSGTVRPLTTFLNADGQYCRAFEAHVSRPRRL